MGQQKRTTASKKKKTGRPAAVLTERSQVRHAPGEWERWEEAALARGYSGAGALIRHLLNTFTEGRQIVDPLNGSPAPSRS